MIYSREQITKKRQDDYNDKFGERQREYDDMLKPIPAPIVEFPKIEDEAITNMDELIKKFTEEREKELEKKVTFEN